MKPIRTESSCLSAGPRRIFACGFFLVVQVLLLTSVAAASPITGVNTGTAGFVGMSEFGPYDTPVLITSYGEFLTTFGGASAGLANPYLAPSIAGFFVNGGQRIYVVRVANDDAASLIGVDGGPGSRTGLQALLDIDEVSVVAIPGCTSQVVQNAMIVHCETAGDRMALLDPSLSADVAAVLAQRSLLASADGFAALYFPWVQAAPAGELLWLPPSGFVAGIYANTDTPDSPVGPIATATDVSVSISDVDQNILNPVGINAIRFFPGQGVLVWGARTIASHPEWIYVVVRRMKLYLEESIIEGTEWASSEPNDATLWAQLQSDIASFLHDRYLLGWFQGAQPEDAYFARCDSSTMTQVDLDEGRTVMLVGFAPVFPAEFIFFEVEQHRLLFADGFESGDLSAWSN